MEIRKYGETFSRQLYLEWTSVEWKIDSRRISRWEAVTEGGIWDQTKM